jgi:hypothetical protein
MVIAFSRKTDVLYYIYKLWDCSVTRTGYFQRPCGTTRHKTEFPRTNSANFLPVLKKAMRNRHYDLLFLCFESLLTL